MEERGEAHARGYTGRARPDEPGAADRTGGSGTLVAGLAERLVANWVYGGALAGLLLLALFPLLTSGWPETLRLTFLYLPLYMLHQYEEHDADRFRRFFNATVGQGREVLTPKAVFLINVPGVWGVIALATYLAALAAPGLGLIAVYMAAVNAVVHVGHAALFQRYNPGLGTAVVLFLPAGAYTIQRFDALGYAGWVWQVAGFGSAAAIHIGIVAYAVAQKRRLAGSHSDRVSAIGSG